MRSVPLALTMPKRIANGAGLYVGDNERLLIEVRAGVLGAPELRAWLIELAELREYTWRDDGQPIELGRAAAATDEYWRAVEVVAHDYLEGLILAPEIDQILRRFAGQR